MELRELNENELGEVLGVHMPRDFPAEELRPEWTFRNMLSTGACRFYGLFRGERLAAYGDVVKGYGSDLLDFFAVMPELRGTGVGTAALRALAKMSGELILEVESPGAAPNGETELLRRRRIEFYKRSGALETGVSGRALGVEFLIHYMGDRREFTLLGDELREIYRTLYPGLDVDKEVTYGI